MARRTRIGVMVPSTNTTVEADFQLLVPRDVTVHGQRMWLTNDAADMSRMNADIELGARTIGTAAVDVVAYCCTMGSFQNGPAWDRETLAVIARAAGAPAVAAAPAVAEALHALGARRLSVATPYPEAANARVRAYLEASGFEVLNVEGEPRAARAGNQGINDQEPEDVLAFSSRVCRPEADALLCSCSAWRSLEVLDVLEGRVGRPVVCSNQASAWAAFRALGLRPCITGFGRLFRTLDPVTPA